MVIRAPGFSVGFQPVLCTAYARAPERPSEARPTMDGARAAQRCRLFGVAGAVIGTALVCSAALLLRGPSDPAGHAAAVDLASESGLEKRRPQPSPLDKPPRRTLEYEWVVTSVWDRRPDCMAVDERWPRRVLLVNGQHIGPHINVTRGDIVKVKVTNMIEARDFGHNEMHGITIHWHGLKQRSKTQWSDGVGWLTQCPIGYNRSYTYVLDTAQDSVGTHWWHAHTGSDNADGMYGAFVVREPANRRLPKEYAYDADLPVLFVQGWWNYSAPSLEWGLQQQELRWVANAQSILMNGKGVNGPSLDKRAEPGNSAGCDLDSLDTWWTYDIQPGRTYRLRVVAAGTLLPINITMPGHRMTIIEADGAYVQPLEVDELLVNLGQRYSVLFTADQPVGNYEIVASVYGRQARSGQCALEYRKSFEYEWEAGTFSTTQSCGGLDPAEAGVDAARRAALDGQAIETNFRLPSGLAVLHYTGAPYSLARLHQGRYGSEEEKLRARTINWVQNLTIAQRDALSRRVAAFENRLRANTNLNSYDSGQKLPTSRGAVPRVDMALTTWWPGKLPQRWHDDALPGYITAPTLADGPGVRAGALPVYKWAVNNVTQAFGAKRGVASARGLPVETQFYAKTVQGYEITPDYELWPKPGDGPNPTYTLGVFAWQLDFGAIVDFVIYNDDLAEEHPCAHAARASRAHGALARRRARSDAGCARA